jgi:ATP-dependent Clp protease ATP-binding subunit ClpX
MFGSKRLACSFCRKNASEVSKLVAGPRVTICDACVALARRIMDESPTDAPAHPGAVRARRPSLWDFVSGLWRRGVPASA